MWYILYPCGWKIMSSYPLMLDNLYPCGWKTIPSSSTYVRYFVPLWLENHTFVIHLCKIFCTPAVGKSYLRHTFDNTYVRYFVPRQLENHTFVIHLHEKYSTLAVGKPYLSSYIYDEKYCIVGVWISIPFTHLMIPTFPIYKTGTVPSCSILVWHKVVYPLLCAIAVIK